MEARHNLLARQLRKHFGPEIQPPDGWGAFVAAVDLAYRDFDADRELVERSLELSSRELFAANSEIRAMLQALPDLVLRLDHFGTVRAFNAGEGGTHLPPRALLGRRLQDTLVRQDSHKFNAALVAVLTQKSTVNLECCERLVDREIFYEIRLGLLLENQIIVIVRNITARKQSEAELIQAQKDLVETSRLAGMAEVATGVLHNVGNVLNSVNVGAGCVAEGLRKSRLSSLTKVVALLHEHEQDLAGFFAADPRGKQLVGYLTQLAAHLAHEQTTAITELAGIQKNIEHIKDIVAMQQNFATVSGVKETIPAAALVADALQMNISSIERHDVRVIKEFQEVPPVVVDKHKALQILVNLIRNAKQSCDATNRDDKQLSLRIRKGDDCVQICIGDNGVGIPPENLVRVFNHGFTTKKDGHGFGLHSGALAAAEMGGALRVHSDGVGRGATFTVELPTSSKNPRAAETCFQPKANHPAQPAPTTVAQKNKTP